MAKQTISTSNIKEVKYENNKASKLVINNKLIWVTITDSIEYPNFFQLETLNNSYSTSNYNISAAETERNDNEIEIKRETTYKILHAAGNASDIQGCPEYPQGIVPFNIWLRDYLIFSTDEELSNESIERAIRSGKCKAIPMMHSNIIGTLTVENYNNVEWAVLFADDDGTYIMSIRLNVLLSLPYDIESAEDNCKLEKINNRYTYNAGCLNNNGLALPITLSTNQLNFKLNDYAYAFDFTNNSTYAIVKNLENNTYFGCVYNSSSKTLAFHSDCARDGGSSFAIDKEKLGSRLKKIYFDFSNLETEVNPINFACKSVAGPLSNYLLDKQKQETSVTENSSSGNVSDYAYYEDKILFKADSSNEYYKYLKVKIKIIFTDGTSVEKDMTKISNYNHSFILNKENIPETTLPISHFTFNILFDEEEIYKNTLVFTLGDDKTYYSVAAANTNISGDIKIPETYKGLPVQKIDRAGFKSCTSITKIVVPDSVINIGYEAFAECTSLKSITIPKNLKIVGSSTSKKICYNCTSLTEINYNAIDCTDHDGFWQGGGSSYVSFGNAGINSTGITLNIGPKVKRFSGGLVQGYSPNTNKPNITKIIFSPNSEFEELVGSGQLNITEINLPASLKIIRGGALSSAKITSLTIPKNVNSIGKEIVPQTYSSTATPQIQRIIFEDPYNWECCEFDYFPEHSTHQIQSSILTDQTEAAKALSFLYRGFYWRKKS